MEELIKVRNDNGELLVSARDLYEGLELKERFSKWFNRMLSYGFEESIDYNMYQKVQVQIEGGREVKRTIEDYVLKLDMAKEICMIQRSDKGREYRKYLIKCEERLKAISQVPALSLPDDIKKEINNFKEDANYIREHVHIKKLDSSVYVKTIKNYLGISTISEDKVGYEFIKDMFFAEMGVTKFEDITVSSDNLVKLNECCKKYKRPYEQLNIFD